MRADSGRYVGKRNRGLSTAARYAVLVVFGLIFLLPIVFMIMSSFKPDFQLLSDTSSLRAFLPIGDVSLDNYTGAFERAPLGRFIFNSVFITVVTVGFGLFLIHLQGFPLPC